MWPLIFDIIVVLCVAGVLCVRRKKPAYPLPPGPKGLPILGNALDIPKNREWVTYEKWGKELSMGFALQIWHPGRKTYVWRRVGCHSCGSVRDALDHSEFCESSEGAI